MDPWGTPAVTGSHVEDWPFQNYALKTVAQKTE